VTETEEFLARFAAFGAHPDAAAYQDLFDPDDGTVLHPGMSRPLHRNQVREYMTRYLATIVGFGFEIEHWAERDGTVFVEARNRGSVGGEPLAWNTVYCVTLRGSRVLRGRAYADRIPILGRLLPDMTLGEAAALDGPAPGLTDGD
jgi:ketosteroid isomerase-like protein